MLLPPASPALSVFEQSKLLAADPEAVARLRLRIDLSFSASKVFATFATTPAQRDALPLAVRVFCERDRAARVTAGQLLNASEEQLFTYALLLDLAHALARYLHLYPGATEAAIRAFVRELAPSAEASAERLSRPASPPPPYSVGG